MRAAVRSPHQVINTGKTAPLVFIHRYTVKIIHCASKLVLPLIRVTLQKGKTWVGVGGGQASLDHRPTKILYTNAHIRLSSQVSCVEMLQAECVFFQ